MGGKGSGGYRKNALPRDKNPVVQGLDPLAVDADVNRRAIAFGRSLVALEVPDLSDLDEIKARFDAYLDMCEDAGVKPLVAGLAMAFGMDRRAFRGIVSGDPHFAKYKGVTPEVVHFFQKIYEFLEVYWENGFMEETGNPVKHIFYAKNHFGYTDQAERIVRHVEERRELPTAEEVADKYRKMAGRPDSGPIEIEPVSVESLPAPDSEDPGGDQL